MSSFKLSLFSSDLVYFLYRGPSRGILTIVNFIIQRPAVCYMLF